MKPFPYLVWAQHWTPYQEFSPLLELETINSPKLLLDSGRIQVLGVGGVWYRPAHLMTEMYGTKREPEDLNTKGSVHTKGPHRVQICYKSTCCVERQVLKCWHRMELEGCLGLELLFPQQLLCVCMFSNMWSFFRGYRKFEYQNVFKVHPPSPSKFTPFCSGGLVRPRTFCILLLGRFLFRVQIWVIIEFRSSQLRPSQMWEHKQIREPNTPCVPFDVFLFKFYHRERCEKLSNLKLITCVIVGLKECVAKWFSPRASFAGLFQHCRPLAASQVQPVSGRWDSKWSSEYKTKSRMVKVEVSFQMSRMKKNLLSPSRILFCIPMPISRPIFSGTSCNSVLFWQLYSLKCFKLIIFNSVQETPMIAQ